MGGVRLLWLECPEVGLDVMLRNELKSFPILVGDGLSTLLCRSVGNAFFSDAAVFVWAAGIKLSTVSDVEVERWWRLAKW